MATIRINVESKDSTEVYSHFLNETKGGKYTDLKPDLTLITYERLNIQEQESVYTFEENTNNVLLYGIAF